MFENFYDKLDRAFKFLKAGSYYRDHRGGDAQRCRRLLLDADVAFGGR